MSPPNSEQRAIAWLLGQAVGRQRTAAVVHAAWRRSLEYLDAPLARGFHAEVREESLLDVVLAQQSAAYHATLARECLLAALRLKDVGACQPPPDR